MELKGKTAIITGSTSGIGLGIAQGFAAEGINIMLNGFGDPADIEKERSAIEAQGVKCVYNGADMTKPNEVTAMVEEAVTILGSIDIVVNNAGIQHVAPVEDFSPEKWDAIIAINMSSSFHTVRVAIPHMKRQGWGRVINIDSAHGLVASPFKSAYVTAKHGMLGFTKTIALEVAEDNITCNAICPGYVLTPLVEKQIPATAKARGISEEEVKRDVLLAAQWTKKFVSVEQLAGTALFLCSDHAENITGTHISVDGGWTAG
ncbi:MAG: 3-hydroxybutyrate dehydrogenase [Piscirickettsiaceae bacterium]|nr:MAG: 3-hydroxybutyrate dehydrogenase [Piscirickettsiaceae bacterium]PCI67816.1 MAG: 3-hydroxybutyrate dehydrogenase [Piscirickettsiaceae bacterium]